METVVEVFSSAWVLTEQHINLRSRLARVGEDPSEDTRMPCPIISVDDGGPATISAVYRKSKRIGKRTIRD